MPRDLINEHELKLNSPFYVLSKNILTKKNHNAKWSSVRLQTE